MKNLIFLLFILISFEACIDRTSKEDDLNSLKQIKLKQLKKIGENYQTFLISQENSSTIVGKFGTTLIFPAKSIIDLTGNLYMDSIKVELVECISAKDFILSNLQTKQDSLILESTGMINFRAFDKNGNRLILDNSKKIRIRIPQDSINPESKIFKGIRDKSGYINWVSEMEPEKSLIAYPIKYISKNKYNTECSDFYGISRYYVKNKRGNYKGNILDFENTFLATNEFYLRYHTHCSEYLVKTYIENIDKNLWEVDQIILDKLYEELKSANDYYDKHLSHDTTKPALFKSNRELRKSYEDHYNYDIKRFTDFRNQRLTRVDTTVNVDTIELKKFEKLYDESEFAHKVYLDFNSADFGWLNVDIFYNDPKSSKIKLIAKTNREVTTICLLINNRKIVLSGYPNSSDNNSYRFTKDIEGYNRLPIGQKATIIAFDIQDTTLFYGEREVMLGTNTLEEIELTEIKQTDLKKKLNKYSG